MIVEVLEVSNNQDGTTFVSLELDNEAIIAIIQSGLFNAIKYSVAECDCHTEEGD